MQIHDLRPARRASATRAPEVAGVRALSVRVMPSASARMFIVLAVPIMAQAPGPQHGDFLELGQLLLGHEAALDLPFGLHQIVV